MGFKKLSQLIMIEQTLFALPFAYLGVLFAGGGTLTDWVWVTVALAAGRTAGMSFNRVIDAEIDGKNPRTSERLLPKGIVHPRTVWGLAAISSAALIGAAYMLNNLCFYLSFAAVFMLFTYSYFKRFTASSHLYLGLAEAAAPIGGYLAVTGKWAFTPFVLGFVITMWIAGLDIVYALQDMDFDTRERLHSIPVRVGKKLALTASAFCYALAVSALVVAGIRNDMTSPYWIGVGCVALIFAYQQRLARSDNLVPVIKKVFNANMCISPTLLAATAIVVIMR